ncbi:hypothetical protein ONS95_006341 [Cadophora gregata]|uniref:uncharacterized protein n=1 Tax=Cadophora gregata TaxID=51156 RepID=UPI0026DA9189|nr:uncharacterized protein ONS95_006341 [Cadophora gregata]KAK0102743.1 hypothetical protein ONS95_006341 [Cadophora gregata]
MAEASSYQHLQAGEIRLMVLLPGNARDQLSVRLVTSSLQADGRAAAAAYEALSYQWGPPSPARIITVDGQPVEIRENLYMALIALRDKQFPRCLWVDALCINQRNDVERGSQVSIMSKIFRQAAKVLVWLGAADDDSDLLFELMAKVEGRLDRLDSLITVWGQAGVDVSTLTKQRIQSAFLSVSRRPYWTRLWIIQEVLSASSIDLLCGSKILPWALFSSGLEANGNLKISPDIESCALTPAYAIAAKQSYHNHVYPIRDLVQLCDICNSQCEDVRDKIYGLISIAKDFDIAPDYTKSTTELCLDIFKYLNQDHLAESTRSRYPSNKYLDETLFRTLQRLLMNPFWDPVESCYPAVDEGVMSTWARSSRSYTVVIHQYSEILKVGSVIDYTRNITESSIIQPKPQRLTNGTMLTQDAISRKLLSLATHEIHETTAMREVYTRSGNTDEYIKINGPTRSTNSNGKVRTFLGSNDEDGIALCEIQESDMLCLANGIEEYFVIRIETERKFVLIGRAIRFFIEGHRHKARDDAYNARTRPSFRCKFNLNTLFLLNR